MSRERRRQMWVLQIVVVGLGVVILGGLIVRAAARGTLPQVLANVLELVPYVAVPAILAVLVTMVWAGRVNRRTREVSARFPDSVVRGVEKTPGLSGAMSSMDYVDEVGAGLELSGLPASLVMVAGPSGFDLWGGPVGAMRLYLRLPWRDIVSVNASTRELAIQVNSFAGVVTLPLKLRRAHRSETIASVALLVEKARLDSGSTAPAPSRNSRIWRSMRAELGRWHESLSSKRDPDHVAIDLDDAATEASNALAAGASKTEVATLLPALADELMDENMSSADAIRIVGQAMERAGLLQGRTGRT